MHVLLVRAYMYMHVRTYKCVSYPVCVGICMVNSFVGRDVECGFLRPYKCVCRLIFRSNGSRPRPLQYLRRYVSEAATDQGMVSVYE